MGIDDVKAGMYVTVVEKNGRPGEEYKARVTEKIEGGIIVDCLRFKDEILSVSKEKSYLLNIFVDNELYNWEDIKVTALRNGTYKIVVSGNPKVLNRRKYKRMPMTNRCTITLSNSGQQFSGGMINISAGGFAFATTAREFANIKGSLINVQINDFALLDGKKLQGYVIRITDNNGQYILGCRMPEDNMDIYNFVEKNYRGM